MVWFFGSVRGANAASGPGMDVRCDRCQTEYELDDGSVTEAGASVQCTSCGHTFIVSRPAQTPTPSPVGDAGGPSWILTTAEGKTHRFRDTTTLQKWIVERRVTRSDRVCSPGGAWQRLADMDELRPFFDVVDQADRVQADRAAVPRGVRPTHPETPSRLPPAGTYGSVDVDDDDVFGSERRLGAGRGVVRESAMRFDSEVTAGLEADDGLGFDVPARRRGPKVFAGLLVVGLAIGIGGYFGWGSRRPSETNAVAVAPTGAPGPGPAGPPVAERAPAAPVPKPAAAPIAVAPAAPPPAAAAPSPPPSPAPSGAALGKAAAPAREPDVAAEPAPSSHRGGEATRGSAHPSASPSEAPRPRSYEQLVADGDRALENGNTAKAQKMFDEALKIQPDGVAAVTGSGYLMLDKQRPLAAIGMFKRALASAPAFPQALFGLGEAYRTQGDSASAIDAYKKYLSVAPNGSDAPAARRQLRELENQAPTTRHAASSPPDEPSPAAPASAPTAPPPAN
jgi:predicted Zn finger-like uncharacterized protein